MWAKLVWISVILASVCVLGSDLILRQYEVWDREEYWNRIHCVITVRSDSLNFVTDLKLQNFVITEFAYDNEGNVLVTRPASFDNPSYQFNGSGFWEESVSSDKLDVVFLIDSTGSMEKHVSDVKEQLRIFVKRLMEYHTDFRMVVAKFETDDTPRWPDGRRVNFFYGPMMVEELEYQIEELSTAGEWWNFQWGYDAFLWALELPWREDARKIVVIITDVFTDSVHGPNWYFAHGCSTSPYAVDIAMRERNINLYFCQPDEENMAKIELAENFSEMVNPKVREANFDILLRLNNLTKKLSWPFDQSEIELEQAPLADSKYHFVWVSDFTNVPYPLREKISKVKVSIATADGSDQAEFNFCPSTNLEPYLKTTVKISIRDETGQIPQGRRNVDVRLYKVIGELGRFEKISEGCDENGAVELILIPLADYYCIVETGSRPDYRYYTLGLHWRGWLSVKELESSFEIKVNTAYKDIEIYRLRGLIQECKLMKIATSRTIQLACQVESLLNDVLKDNAISIQELDLIKRTVFEMAVLTNCSHYATVENDRLFDDILQTVDKVNNMLNKALKLAEELSKFKDKIESAVNVIIDIVTGNWEGIAKDLTAEALVQKLIDYIKQELPDRIIDALIDKLFEVSSMPNILVEYFDTFIRYAIRDNLVEMESHIENFVLTKLVQPNYVYLVDEALEKLLSRAKAFLSAVPSEWIDLNDHSTNLKEIFEKLRQDYMDDLFQSAYDNLKEQPVIDDWASTLSTFNEMLMLVLSLVQILQSNTLAIEQSFGLMPDFTPLISTITNILPAFDQLGTMTKTLEIALKANHLLSMQTILREIPDHIFGY